MGSLVKEKPVNLSAKVQAARQLFLYGGPDGKRVLEPPVLAKRVGCHVSSIWSYIKDWSREFETLLIQTSDFELGTVLSDEDVEKFRSDVNWARKVTDELRKEHDLVETLEENLFRFIENGDFSEETEHRLVTLAEKFFSAVHTKSKLRSQWIAMEKEWVRMSGIEGKMEIVQNAEKARAIGRVKIDLKREETEQTPGLKVAKKPVGGIFAD